METSPTASALAFASEGLKIGGLSSRGHWSFDYATTRAVIVLLAVTASSLCYSQPSAPELISPASGTVVQLSQILTDQVLLDWSDVPGAVTYEVDITGPPGFANPVGKSPFRPPFRPYPEISEIQFNFTTLGGTEMNPARYSWQIRAFDGETFSPYSETWEILVTGRIDPTPSPTVTPHPLQPFDLNNSGVVAAGDLLILYRSIRDGGQAGDFDDSGLADAADLMLFSIVWQEESQGVIGLGPTPIRSVESAKDR